MEERLTLISDATDEFPNNTNNSYRVRIPDGLRLDGTGWHIALLSLTLPNSTSVQSTVIKANHPLARLTLHAIHFRVISGNRYTVLDKLKITEDVYEPQTPIPINGVGYWNNAVTVFEMQVANAVSALASKKVSLLDPSPLIMVKKTMRPAFRWDGEIMIMESRRKDITNGRNTIYSAFDMNLDVAYQWGFAQKKGNIWIPGPNVRYAMDNFTITDANPPRSSSLRPEGIDTLNGKAFALDKRDDMPRYPKVVHSDYNRYHVVWHYTYENKEWIRFSGQVEWQFINLNQTFMDLHRHTGQAIMVYTNLQQSTIVGGSKAQLLRELVIERGGEAGHSYSEPTHLQWIPVSTHSTDIVEVQIADVNGNLLSLPQGKSLVTVALKQIV